GWNPYTVLDAGFQLSFAAVVAIFVLAPRLAAALDGYPLPGKIAGFLAISTACGLATAPILWLQFHAVPLLAVPANALAAPAVGRLRSHFDPEAVERLWAVEASGDDVVAACNALGLFGGGSRLVLVEGVDRWKAADGKAIADYLGSPTPDTVLALVGGDVKKD